MPSEIVLLTGDVEGPHLTAVLRRHAPALDIHVAITRADLERLTDPPKAGRRLVSFCTGVVVPARILDGLDGPAYNFHPGSPEYPDSCSAGFAIYDGATRFGATAHEMRAAVDSGPIVAVDWFEVPADAKYVDLELMTYERLLGLFQDLAPRLATDDSPLPTIDQDWTGRTRTKAEAAHLVLVQVRRDGA